MSTSSRTSLIVCPKAPSALFVEDLRQLCSEFRRFCGVAGECFGLVVQTCVREWW